MYILYYEKDNELKIVDKNSVIDDLYYSRAKLPSKKNINDHINNNKNNKKNKTNKKIVDFFMEDKKINIDKKIDEIKKAISEIDNKVPLYDEYSKNLYIIDKENVYYRVMYQYYRFPDRNMYDYLVDKMDKLYDQVKNLGTNRQNRKIQKSKDNLGEFDKSSKIHYKIVKSDVFLQREYRKLNLMIKFLDSFDLDILYDTYVKVFYNYSNAKNITICIRPSFLPHFKHIKPYYTRSELINMALNMELVKPSNIYYDNERVMKLCGKIKKNDISSDILLKHQQYIIKNNKIGVIQYYSLQGSYFINQYMRGFAPYDYKNSLLEDIILSMWNLILGAPEFDKSYILYRFIKNDNHIKHLKIGQSYTVPSFMSTTRDPFYRSDVYKFGFILIKVKIPANIKGVALCIETLSHFSEEQEIILPPSSVLRLDKKDRNAPYYHTDDIYEAQIQTRYEFTYLNNNIANMPERIKYDETQIIDFLKIDSTSALTIDERISYFISKYVNPLNQFKTLINNKEYTIITEWYDSTEAYKEFYAARTSNGFSFYTIADNFMVFMIELGEDNNGAYMYVNYYFRYSSINIDAMIPDKELVLFISSIANYFQVTYVIIYADYSSCDRKESILDTGKKIYHGGNYCIDFYNYLKNNKKKYSLFDSTEIKPRFSYYQLDRLKKESPLKILRSTDRDEIYQIYSKVYTKLDTYSDNMNNLADFYVWMAEHQCIFMSDLEDKMDRIYDESMNPFKNDYYILNTPSYLYNNGYIESYPTYESNIINFDKDEGSQAISPRGPKNMYRLSRKSGIRIGRSE